MKLKTMFSFFALFSMVLCFNNNNYAQNNFEGKITFKAFDDDGIHSMDYYVKGNKVRFDTKEEEQDGQIIWDTSTKQFMAIMPQEKMYMVMQLSEPKMKKNNSDEMGENIKFIRTGETKKILGYTAEKLKYKDDQDQGEAWVTQELGAFKLFDSPMHRDEDKPQWQKDFDAAGYFPLEVYENGKKVFEIISIEKKSLDESMFEAPSDYKKMEMPKTH